MDSEGGTSASVMGIDSAASIGDEEAVESNSAEHPSSRRRMVSPVALSFAGAADTTPPAPEQPASAHLAAAPQQQQSPSQVISTPSPAPAPVPAPAAAPASTPAESKTEAVSSVQNDEAAALAASIALARQLMQEESMHVYAQLQHETLMVQREIAMQHANQGIEASEEDADLLYALELAQQEQEAAQHGIADDEDFDTDNMDYDQLMQLGSRMGDVAQQRWELDSKNVIQQLPHKRLTEQDIKERTDAAKSNGAGSKLALVVEDPTKCLICQCEYEADECVRQLPCGHEFHMGCVDQWLSGSKTCPVCKASVDVAAQDSAPDAVAGGGEQKQ